MKAILYAAESTEDIRGSIPTQLQDSRIMAKHQSWEIAGEYAEQAVSAWKSDRGPQLEAAMRHAEQIAPCVLLVQHSDRLARGDGRTARHLGEIYFWAIKASVELHSVQDDSTFANPLLTFAMGERNAEDSRRKSVAVAAGMKRLVERGKHIGGPRPYGFRVVDGGLRAVPKEQAVVQRIDAEFLGGKTLTAIARGLHRDGLRTAQGKIWRPSTVRAILANPMYVGRRLVKGKEYPGDIDPCRSEIDHAQVSTMLGDPSSIARGRLANGNFLFRRGMLRCGRCGHGMTSRTDRRWELEHYLCSGRMMQGPEFCDMPTVKRIAVDGAVYRYFEQVGLDVEATRRTIADARDRKLTETHALRADAEREARKAEERLTRVRRDYTDGELSVREWREFRDELQAEHAAANAEADRLRTQEHEVQAWGELRDAEAYAWRRLSEIRAVIVGHVRDADGLDGVRAALNRTFEHFVLQRDMTRVHVELIADAGLVIEPVVREQAVKGYTENLRPILRREPLEPAPNGQLQPAIFGPIAVDVGQRVRSQERERVKGSDECFTWKRKL